MFKKSRKQNNGIRLLPDSSWGKETMKFKVDKRSKVHDKELVRCTGVKCMQEPNKMDRAKVYKGQECAVCYSEFFKELRFSPQSETPNFDPQFLTRLNLG